MEEDKPRPSLPDPITRGAMPTRHLRSGLGGRDDGDALNVVVAAVAVERMTGDPLWLLVVSGSGQREDGAGSACRALEL
jgi:hypothetical protein